MASLGVFIYQFGFNISENQLVYTSALYRLTFLFYFFRLSISNFRNLFQKRNFKKIFSYLYYLLILVVFFTGWIFSADFIRENLILRFLSQDFVVYIFTAIHVVFGLSRTITRSLSKLINTNWLFVGSFLFLIFAGTGLLMLPRATYIPISFLDALFTSVSAVCVTGLVVVDTVTTFTPLGKTIIILLIQLGGIGIMTFTSFFGLFAESKYSFKNQIVIKDLINDEEGIGHIFNGLRNIILVTFFVELIGASYLFYVTGGQSWEDAALAGFHSVSAFCNAGFSILPGGLIHESVMFNNWYLLGISFLIIIGGLGFPIIFNVWTWLRKKMANLFRSLIGKGYKNKHVPRVLNTATVIVLVTTSVLLISGTLIFYFTEYHHTLNSLDEAGKLVTAFFMSVTPRTAGFNSFNMSELTSITLIWMIFFMWIGASPMSTGGGIKTTTFGIAVLNVWNTLRGRESIEIRYRQIAPSTVNRAFVIIFMSVMILSISILLIHILEPAVPVLSVVFECVSAISTVGLSVDLTPLLSEGSRIVLIVLMFVGRIGFFSLMSCFIRTKSLHNYRYPYEHISIN
jgi:potassium uptake TrkH family protein